MNKIKLIKSIDRIAGKIFVFLLSVRGKFQRDISAGIENILLIRPGGIGDAVLLLPVIQSLREHFHNIRIDVLCEKRNAGIFELARGINRLYRYDSGFALFRCLGNRYDVVIDTEQWHRLSAAVAALTSSPVKIGFATNERGKLFSHRIPYSHDDYEVLSFFLLVEPLTSTKPDFNADKPFIDIADDSFPGSFLELSKNDRVIAIFPGASVRERRWGGERFGKVAKALEDEGYKILILGSRADRSDADVIKKYATRCVDLTGRTSLRDVAAILKRCRLLIAADSGIMHIGYAVGTPMVSLFGSGIEKKWAPCGKKHIVINKHLPCSPCTRFGYTPRCKRNVECLTLISTEEVVDSARSLLKEK